jgi:hypothetical protein
MYWQTGDLACRPADDPSRSLALRPTRNTTQLALLPKILLSASLRLVQKLESPINFPNTRNKEETASD